MCLLVRLALLKRKVSIPFEEVFVSEITTYHRRRVDLLVRGVQHINVAIDSIDMRFRLWHHSLWLTLQLNWEHGSDMIQWRRCL